MYHNRDKELIDYINRNKTNDKKHFCTDSDYKISFFNSTTQALDQLFSAEELKIRLQQNSLRYQNATNIHQETPLVWVATKNGHSPIYIFNSMHYTIDYNFKDYFRHTLDAILNEVDVVFTEVRVSDNYKIPIEGTVSFDLYRLDSYIAKKARKKDRRVIELENTALREIAGCEMRGTFKDDLALFRGENLEIKNLLESATKNYLSGEWGKEFVDDQSVSNRNFLWMDKILLQSNSKNRCLVVCGGNHSIGQYGLPNLLACEGYDMNVLIAKPITLSELVDQSLKSTSFSSYSANGLL